MQKGQKDNHRCATSECCRDATHPHHPLNLHSFVLNVPKKRRVNILDQPQTKKTKRRHAGNFRWDLTAGFYFYT